MSDKFKVNKVFEDLQHDTKLRKIAIREMISINIHYWVCKTSRKKSI